MADRARAGVPNAEGFVMDETFVKAGQQPANPAEDSVVHAWLDIQGLTERAANGRLLRIPQTGLDRQAVINNSAILEPIISFYGHLAKDSLTNACEHSRLHPTYSLCEFNAQAPGPAFIASKI